MSNASSVVATPATPRDLVNFVIDLSVPGTYDKTGVIAAAPALAGLADGDLFEVDFDVKAGAPTLAAPVGNPAITLNAGDSTAFQGTLASTGNVVVEYIDDFTLTLAAGDQVRITGRAG